MKKLSKKGLKAVGRGRNGRFEPKKLEPMCIECGCTEDKACEGGCVWAVKGSVSGERGKFWVCSNCV
jgi:hypothetical protein